MAFVYEELQLFLVIPKVIQGIISLITAIVVFRKSKYIVNRAFFLAFLMWGIVPFLDATMYLIAANSEADLFIANILRDVALALANFTCFTLLFAVLVINRGTAEATSKKMIALIVSLFLVIFIFTDIFDRLAVFTLDNVEIPAASLPLAPGTFRVTAPSSVYTAIGYIASLTIFIINIAILVKLLRKIKNPVEKRHIRLFLAGLILLVGGYMWFFLIVAAKFQTLASYWFGYIIWTLAPVFSLMGVYTPEGNSEKVMEKDSDKVADKEIG
jgi:hypothetical protein